MVKKRRVAASGSKIHLDRSPSKDKVTHARDKFKGALQDLIQRSEDESGSSDDETWSNTKRIAASRKRYHNETKSEAETPTPKAQQPFVMKLFDRSLDLAQFNENTPLYVICRSWMNNQPHQSCNRPLTPPPPAKKDDVEMTSDQDESGVDAVKNVYKMPSPLPLTEDIIKIKIPEKVKLETKYTDISDAMESDDVPSKETLLKENLLHWNKVRRTCLSASSKNEKRFEKSGEILSAMFSKAQKQY